MPNTLSRVEVKQFALIGAQARLDALNAEIASLYRAFPELSRGKVKTAKTTAAAATSETPRKGRGGRKRNWNMSDSQKRAVSERMKKYWAGRRKDKAAKTAKKA
jgi:hypothetical protein